MGLVLVATLALVGWWFIWLYYVTPKSDLERIKADQAGTGAEILDIKRTGIQHERAEDIWVADRMILLNAGKWFRVYDVKISRPQEPLEIYSIGVEARLFGLPGLKRYDLRA